jgi:hypothetical protein
VGWSGIWWWQTGHIIRHVRVLLTSATDLRSLARDYTNESLKAFFRDECLFMSTIIIVS